MLESLLYSFLTLAAFGAICAVLQKISPSVPNQKFWRKDTKTDFTYWLIGNVLTSQISRFIIALFLAILLTYYPLIANHRLAEEIVRPENFLLALIVADFTGYWTHRLFHNKKLWDFHAIHHSPKQIDWLSSYRFHPLESIVVIAIGYTVLLAIGINVKTITLAYTIRGAYGFLVHANLSWNFGPLGYVVASPYFHRWHHTKQKEGLDKNFAGVFSAWDFLFGTAYFPKNKQPHNFGVHSNVGDSFLKQLIYPFKRK